MTDIIQKQPARRIDFSRPLSFLIRPKRVYEEMSSEARAVWLTPMIILTVTAILVVIVAGYLKTQAAMMGEVELPQDWQYWTPDQQNNYMQAQQATQGPTFMYIIPMVGSLTGLWLGWLVLGGLMHLGSTLFGGRGTMQGALNVVAFANLPFALRDILRAVYMLASSSYHHEPRAFWVCIQRWSDVQSSSAHRYLPDLEHCLVGDRFCGFRWADIWQSLHQCFRGHADRAAGTGGTQFAGVRFRRISHPTSVLLK
ncbi:MAG: Yip1 family protein [Anaerolineales bacterium]